MSAEPGTLAPAAAGSGAGVVAGVCALATTPVKGLRLQARSAVRLQREGVIDNRRFFVIDERDRMVNGKQVGALSAVCADYDHERGRLALAFPDGSVVAGEIALGAAIPTRFFSRELPARLVLGPWADALSEYSGRELRLMFCDRARSAVDRGPAGTVSLISHASVQELERRAGHGVDPRRFRMLIEVDGTDAHAEDAWVGQRLRIGAALVVMHGHVGRCLVTGQDPDTGRADMPTLELLRGYRRGLETTEPLAFGVYGEVLEPGVVRRGDPVCRVSDDGR